MFEANPSAPVRALGHLPLAEEVESQNLQWIQNPDVPTMALRDGPMCDAKLVPWESYFVTLRVRPLRGERVGAARDSSSSTPTGFAETLGAALGCGVCTI